MSSCPTKMDVDGGNDGPSDPKFLHIPYNKRWEYLKGTIIQLYIEEGEKLSSLATRMKSEYSFDAQPSAYKYQFQKKWFVKKSTSSAIKAQAVKVQLKRKVEDASTSDLTIIQGGRKKPLDKKNFQRFLQDEIRRRRGPDMRTGIFSRWNLPYNALVANFSVPGGSSSPFSSHSNSSPPANVTANSPDNTPPAQPDGPSPTTQLIRKKAYLDRADLFIQGKHEDLLLQLGREERKVVADWLHDFWIHSFMTSKYWGRGPEVWTPGLIAARTFGPVELEGSTPTPEDATSLPWASRVTVDAPSQLCRWSIHYQTGMGYEALPSSPPKNVNEQDIEDESTWVPWTAGTHPTPASTMRSVLSDNSFSRTNEESIPISTSSITETVKRSQGQMDVDAWGFAIMARSRDALEKMKPPRDLSDIYPYHLAASHLDGAHDCCLVFDHLIRRLRGGSVARNYINQQGHTILDSLMVNILRSHTSVSPGEVCQSFEKQNRFPGEEVDICGRWDADSRAIRQLYASGRCTVPFEWKHAYCHTSVQAICHSIIAVFVRGNALDINLPSGLFSRRCGCCRKDLKLLPLHTLVMVAFYLGGCGTPGETLFGVIATLSCMLAVHANASLPADMSISELVLGTPDTGEHCTHGPVTPSELAAGVPDEIVESWSHERQLGWRAFVAVLNFAVSERNEQHAAVKLSKTQALGVLWAASQTEILTYRRIKTTDAWVSDRFDIEQLLQGLNDGRGPTNIPLRKDRLMTPFDNKGWFTSAGRYFYPTAQDVCKDYFMNLEDWGRTTFIRV